MRGLDVGALPIIREDQGGRGLVVVGILRGERRDKGARRGGGDYLRVGCLDFQRGEDGLLDGFYRVWRHYRGGGGGQGELHEGGKRLVGCHGDFSNFLKIAYLAHDAVTRRCARFLVKHLETGGVFFKIIVVFIFVNIFKTCF